MMNQYPRAFLRKVLVLLETRQPERPVADDLGLRQQNGYDGSGAGIG
jgi:hypothetical protein